MANETEQRQNESNKKDSSNNSQGVKGYRKKGLVSEKVLLERLSDMSIEESLLNPVITLSSVDGEAGEGVVAMELCGERPKATLKPSLSLDVPNLSLEDEAKRPPL